MENYTNRKRVGNQVIAPPFRFNHNWIAAIFFITFFATIGHSNGYSQHPEEPKGNIHLQFNPGTADLTDPLAALNEVAEISNQFVKKDSQIVFVKVRTQVSEIPGKDIQKLKLLQFERAEIIKALFGADTLVKPWDLQVLTTISMDSPTTVNYEFHRHDGSLVRDSLAGRFASGIEGK